MDVDIYWWPVGPTTWPDDGSTSSDSSSSDEVFIITNIYITNSRTPCQQSLTHVITVWSGGAGVGRHGVRQHQDGRQPWVNVKVFTLSRCGQLKICFLSIILYGDCNDCDIVNNEQVYDIRDYVDDAREMDEVLNLLFQANPPFLVSMLLNFALDGGLAHTR